MDKTLLEVIILGSTGTIGSKLSRYFISDGFVTHCLSRESDFKRLLSIDKDFIIINCAFSFSGSEGENKELLNDAFQFVKQRRVIYFINMSTIDAYSNLRHGFNLENTPDTEYGKVKRKIDLFIEKELDCVTNLHFLIIGAVTDHGSSWSSLIDCKYFKDRNYTHEAIPTIAVKAIYLTILGINSESKKYLQLEHKWFHLRELNFICNITVGGFFFRGIIRSFPIRLVQKVLRKVKFCKSVQSDLILFENLSERSKNYDFLESSS